MPTYSVITPHGQLSAAQKARIADAVTRIHAEITGAPLYFAQVMFHEVQAGDYFLGGRPLKDGHVFIHGEIRAGRTEEQKKLLLERIMAAVADAGALGQSSVWVYVIEIPAEQMAEFGRMLPRPGEEAAWFAGLPDEERERLESIARK